MGPKDFYSAKLSSSQTFCSFGSALIGALSVSICDNICLAFEDTFSLTLLRRRSVFLAGKLLPHRLRAATMIDVMKDTELPAAAQGSNHQAQRRPCPHRCSGGRRRPHSCTRSRLDISLFPCAWRRLSRRCPDSVCNTLTGQGTVQISSSLPDYARPGRCLDLDSGSQLV